MGKATKPVLWGSPIFDLSFVPMSEETAKHIIETAITLKRLWPDRDLEQYGLVIQNRCVYVYRDGEQPNLTNHLAKALQRAGLDELPMPSGYVLNAHGQP